VVTAGIVIYFEGATLLRPAMSKFLDPLREGASLKRLRIRLVACGDKGRTEKRFALALEPHKFLLVDSYEYPPKGVSGYRHFMVQLMETWLVADWDTLISYFGVGDVMKPVAVEQLSKDKVFALLKLLAERRGKPYRKVNDGARLLARVKLESVRVNTGYCNRLCKQIEATIESAAIR
jgi:hypothetical protein